MNDQIVLDNYNQARLIRLANKKLNVSLTSGSLVVETHIVDKVGWDCAAAAAMKAERSRYLNI
jgi:hypothetical protein